MTEDLTMVKSRRNPCIASANPDLGVREYRKEYTVLEIDRYGEAYDQRYKVVAKAKWNDECRNGHNHFSITGDSYWYDKARGTYIWESGGCIHDIIAQRIPELAPYIKWHLFDPFGPMHYVANTVYHAGDRDCWGKRKGEPKTWGTLLMFGDNPVKHKLDDRFMKFLQQREGNYDLEVIRLDHKDHGQPGKYQFAPNYTFGGYGSVWHEGPFDSESEALDFLTALQTCDPKFVSIVTDWGDGKERDLAAARSTAVWPEATDEELMQEPEALTKQLEARLPALIAEFKKDLETLGFEW